LEKLARIARVKGVVPDQAAADPGKPDTARATVQGQMRISGGNILVGLAIRKL